MSNEQPEYTQRYLPSGPVQPPVEEASDTLRVRRRLSAEPGHGFGGPQAIPNEPPPMSPPAARQKVVPERKPEPISFRRESWAAKWTDVPRTLRSPHLYQKTLMSTVRGSTFR
jgi:hypothetical protein